jgi:anti-sigma factor RsiW
MNCNRWQRQILLAQSGELADGDRQPLDAHLDACPECRAFRDASVEAISLARPALRVDVERDVNLAPIREEAARVASSGVLIRLVRPVYAQVMACAAALLLAAGVWFMMPGRVASNAADPIHNVGTLLSMVSDAHGGVVAVPTQGSEDARLRALAQELLRMEGLSADDML